MSGDLLELVRMAVNATPGGQALDPRAVALVMMQGGITGVEAAHVRLRKFLVAHRRKDIKGLSGDELSAIWPDLNNTPGFASQLAACTAAYKRRKLLAGPVCTARSKVRASWVGRERARLPHALACCRLLPVG